MITRETALVVVIKEREREREREFISSLFISRALMYKYNYLTFAKDLTLSFNHLSSNFHET